MALGRREAEQQGELWVATQELARPAGHAFYERLNDVLAGAGVAAMSFALVAIAALVVDFVRHNPPQALKNDGQ